MASHTYATTNARIAECLTILDELIGWADADAEHAAENGAKQTALDDRWRARNLRKARRNIECCTRD